MIGIDVAKEEDFPTWYQQVLSKGEMLDYYDVSGCYILKVSQTFTIQKLILMTIACFVLHMGNDTGVVQ